MRGPRRGIGQAAAVPPTGLAAVGAPPPPRGRQPDGAGGGGATRNGRRRNRARTAWNRRYGVVVGVWTGGGNEGAGGWWVCGPGGWRVGQRAEPAPEPIDATSKPMIYNHAFILTREGAGPGALGPARVTRPAPGCTRGLTSKPPHAPTSAAALHGGGAAAALHADGGGGGGGVGGGGGGGAAQTASTKRRTVRDCSSCHTLSSSYCPGARAARQAAEGGAAGRLWEGGDRTWDGEKQGSGWRL